MPLFQRAIGLDPNFAMGYTQLGLSYKSLGESELAAENIRKAYELRERVSEPEKLHIESSYYFHVTGDLEKARQAYELWAQIYPRQGQPRGLGSWVYCALGQYDKALEQIREARRLDPTLAIAYADLAHHSLLLNRLEDARATAEEAQAKSLDSPWLHLNLYRLAFLQNDAAGMARELVWSKGKPGLEDVLSANEADTTAYSGRLGRARKLSRQAVASAERAVQKETAADYQAEAALREALFGDAAEARERTREALGLSTGRDAQYGAALALTFGGDAAREQTQIQRLAHDLDRRFPEDTVVQFNYLPTIRARLALSRNDAPKAIEALQAATSYDLGSPTRPPFSVALYPVYVRGEAYLAMHQGSEAAAEFQKILDHRGVVFNEPIAALAHLGLARAYALAGDTTKAHVSTKTSSRYGETPTLTFPSSNEQKRSTLTCSEPRTSPHARALSVCFSGSRNNVINTSRLCRRPRRAPSGADRAQSSPGGMVRASGAKIAAKLAGLAAPTPPKSYE